jgi:hypothetical protein
VLKRIYMIEDYEKQKRKRLTGRKSLMDYAIGVLIVCTGIFFFFRNKFKLEFNENFPPNDMDKVFGVICVLYGAWRIYRGYKKNYFK